MTWKYLRKYLSVNKLTYKQYLAGPHWQDVRRRFWSSSLHDGKCYACAVSGVTLEIHHKTYRRIGAEDLHDLCLLCRGCHQRAHALERGSKDKRTSLANVALKIRKALGVVMCGYKHIKAKKHKR